MNKLEFTEYSIEKDLPIVGVFCLHQYMVYLYNIIYDDDKKKVHAMKETYPYYINDKCNDLTIEQVEQLLEHVCEYNTVPSGHQYYVCGKYKEQDFEVATYKLTPKKAIYIKGTTKLDVSGLCHELSKLIHDSQN